MRASCPRARLISAQSSTIPRRRSWPRAGIRNAVGRRPGARASRARAESRAVPRTARRARRRAAQAPPTSPVNISGASDTTDPAWRRGRRPTPEPPVPSGTARRRIPRRGRLQPRGRPPPRSDGRRGRTVRAVGPRSRSAPPPIAAASSSQSNGRRACWAVRAGGLRNLRNLQRNARRSQPRSQSQPRGKAWRPIPGPACNRARPPGTPRTAQPPTSRERRNGR